MKPFMRATDRGQLAPLGWVSEPAGQWGGRPVDIVYDPRRHDCLLLRGRTSQHLKVGFAEAGYRPVATDGSHELWVRDRVDSARAALARIDRAAGARPAGLGLPGPA